MDADLQIATLRQLLREARDSVEHERAIRGRRDRERWTFLGGVLGRIDAELSREDSAVAAWRAFDASPREHTGAACSVCRKPQFKTPGGDSCENGHGGAPALQEDDIYG